MSSFADSTSQNQVWRYIFAGLCASLDSIGLARFGFTPLIPELIQTHWFPASTVAYLGAANLAGYLFGVLLGRPMAKRFAKEHVLRLMMVLITVAFFACATPISFGWYFGWRFVSGLAGGVVMVLVAATILPHTPPNRKGMASGAIFLGLGLGIAGSGTLIPLLLDLGLAQTWIGLGIFSALLTLISWNAWPAAEKLNAASAKAAPAMTHQPLLEGRNTSLLYLQYGLMAIACIPPMIFLVDFIARGLGRGTYLGSVFWAIYGLGAIIGPPLYGYLADRLGSQAAIKSISAVMAIVFVAFYATSNLVGLGLLTLVIGTFAPGIVPLALARVHEIVVHNPVGQNVVWQRATLAAAAGMAVAAYAYSALFNATGGNHRLLFLSGSGLLALALLTDVFQVKH